MHIPYVQYQEKLYSVDFTYLPPDKLQLGRVIEQVEEAKLQSIVPVYNDLSFQLSRISVGEQLYAADLQYLGDNIFQLHDLNNSLIASLSRTKFQTKHFAGSGVCAQCHNKIEDQDGNDVSIVDAWERSMMANATRDPFWQAKVRSELNRTPELSPEINDKCSRCHAPMANESARKKQDAVQTIFDDGILSPKNPYHDLAMNGVSCSLCHQISPDVPFGTDAGYSGNFSIASYENSRDRLIYGPYKNVLTGPMRNFASFTPTFSEHIKSSELCASCHDLTTPYSDEQGQILSHNIEEEFPEQMVYSEWLHSDYAQTDSCQGCHMPRADGVIIASQPQMLTTKRNDFAQHEFLGANRLMLSMLQAYREQLGVKATDFSKSILSAEQLLQDAAKIEIKSSKLSNGVLNFQVKIDSLTGHKLPSGYPSRRVILHVIVLDSQGNTVFESGKVNSDGSVAGLDSDENLAHYEPHYQTIESEQQVQVYEAIMQDYQNKLTYTLLRAKSYVKDNRLLPLGFNKDTAANKIKVRGDAELDEDFMAGGDVVQFNLKQFSGQEYTIKAELIYQTVSYAFAADLFQDTSLEVKRFKQMFNASSFKSTPMVSAQKVVSSSL
ncbi:cytochrome c family protein [methanotrophic endosymbiont of Bathymodiolus puteoserpentis (Logatchev)]|nr:cytochrome c family protein [methanotrophic endosymbiont of Bathymodiolus puteoserpentis (Logatchev)]